MESPPNAGHSPLPTAKYLVCVSDAPESRVALKLACMKAQQSGGLVDILHVIPPADFQTLSAVAERMRDEQIAEAEALLHAMAEEANKLCGIRPSLLIKEGQIGECIIETVISDADIDMLVLGVAENGKTGTLLSWLAGHLGSRLHVPLLLVPGNLTDQQLMALV